jgi:transposase, IS5 family
MRHYKASQPAGFFAADDRIEELREMGDPVLRLKEAIDWELFRPLLEKLLAIIPKGPGGQRPFDPLMMFKALVLGRLYNLSDEALERQIRRDLSFMSFLGMSLSDQVPDQKTLWEFRQKIGAEEGFRQLFDRFNEHLRNEGMFTKEGRIVDATFVEVPKQRNTRDENAQIKAGQVPEAWKETPHRLSQKDTGARWTKKNHENYYGYKDHVKTDVGSKLIEDFSATSANEHDSQQFDVLVAESDGKVWADSAYTGKACEEALQSRGVEGQICEKGNRAGPLNEQQRASNRLKSKVRARGEHPFAFMTCSMGGLVQRCIGLVRNRWGIALTNLVYNICRYEQIIRLKLDTWNRRGTGQNCAQPA